MSQEGLASNILGKPLEKLWGNREDLSSLCISLEHLGFQKVSLNSSFLVNEIHVLFYKIATRIEIPYLYACVWLHIYHIYK